MNKGHLNLRTKSQECSIEPTAVHATGGYSNPHLVVPVNLTLRPIVSGNGDVRKGTWYTLQSVTATLKCDGFPYKTSEANHTVNILVRFDSESALHVHFPLDSHKISIIEKHRNKNLHIHVNLTFHCAIYSPVEESQGRPSIVSFESIQGSIGTEIPQSHWVTTVLPQLGYKAFRLLEIPEKSDLIPKEYAQSLAELEEASKYFENGDPDKAVAHCRSALDPFKDKIKDLKASIPSNSEYEWIKDVNEATFTWLDTILKKTRAISSKTHHPPSIGHFDKHEAQIIYMVTTAVIGYIGKVEKK